MKYYESSNVEFHIGDRVITTDNVKEGFQSKLGTIKKVYKNTHTVEIEFDEIANPRDGEYWSASFSSIKKVSFAYAEGDDAAISDFISAF